MQQTARCNEVWSASKSRARAVHTVSGKEPLILRARVLASGTGTARRGTLIKSTFCQFDYFHSINYNIVMQCKEKAQFLLKFGGLQRMVDKSEKENRRSKLLGRKGSWQKSLSSENLSSKFLTPRQVRAFI